MAFLSSIRSVRPALNSVETKTTTLSGDVIISKSAAGDEVVHRGMVRIEEKLLE